MSNVIGKRITKFRLDLNMSQATLGEKVGLSGARISQIEQGTSSPRITKVGLIAKALRKSTAEIFGSRIAAAAEGIKQDKTVQTRTVAVKAKPVARKAKAKVAASTPRRRTARPATESQEALAA